jgi:hypothetical protein
MADETADYFRQKAEQCRRLAAQIPNQHDPMVTSLLAMAVEFEAKAVALTAQEVSERQTDTVKDDKPEPPPAGASKTASRRPRRPKR